MSEETRKRLAKEQEALLQCLMSGADPPSGFNKSRTAICARMLQKKRLRAILRIHSWLKAVLGDELECSFALYVRKFPSGHPDGVAPDAARLIGYLRSIGRLRQEGGLSRFSRVLRRALRR